MSEEPKPKVDVVLLHEPTPDGEGVKVLRLRDETLSLGEVRPAREGQPLVGNQELVKLKPREGASRVCDVDVLYAAEPENSPKLPESPKAPKAPKAPKHGGPPKVSSPAYRANWDAIFGPQPTSKLN